MDFGGNTGELLMDAGCTIRPENYYCLDVLEEALEAGRKRFPKAHWIHYDRYNCSFNPEGIADLPIPDIGIQFDIILAYSVFTHTTRDEMGDLVAQLRSRLVPGGVLAFTFIDPHWKSWPATYEGDNLKWRLEKALETNPAVDVSGLLEQSSNADWCALVDGAELYVNSNGIWDNKAHQSCLSYNVYYTVPRSMGKCSIAVLCGRRANLFLKKNWCADDRGLCAARLANQNSGIQSGLIGSGFVLINTSIYRGVAVARTVLRLFQQSSDFAKGNR
jgi:SAM-dependent methyltransferase